jgi:hypothetical protein
MKRIYIYLLYLFILLIMTTSIHGTPLDLIVMVDTSESMEDYFDNLMHFIITEIIEKNLKEGDIFHLIRFSEQPVHELTRTIGGKESSAAILKKVFSLKRKLLFGKYTDLVEAIRFTILYAEGLHTQNKKKMLLLTDGIHEPPPDSPYAKMDRETVEAEVKKYAQTIIQKDGWSVHILRIPLNDYKKNEQKDHDEVKKRETVPIDTQKEKDQQEKDRKEAPIDEKKDGKSLLDIFSKYLGITITDYDDKKKPDLSNKTAGFPYLQFPGNLGKQGRIITIPFYIENFQKDEIIIKLITLETEGKNILHGTVAPKRVPGNSRVPFKVRILLPVDFPKGPCNLPVTLTFDDDNRISPREGILSFYYTGDFFVTVIPFIIENLHYIFIILIIIALLVILFIFIRTRVFEGVFSDIFRPGEWGDRAKPLLEEGEKLIEMRVSFQNPHIGFRNIHKIDDNRSISVGGGLSSYLIFLIPMPPHIAEISNEDGVYVFTPLRKEFFPDLTGPIKNCLNIEIPLVSSHQYRTYITFLEYESPLLKLNRLLHSVEHG